MELINTFSELVAEIENLQDQGFEDAQTMYAFSEKLHDSYGEFWEFESALNNLRKMIERIAP